MTFPLPQHGVLLFTGDVFCDLVFTGADVPKPGQESYADHFTIAAGAAAIRAVAAARLGAPSRVRAKMGDDLIGSYIHRLLETEPNLDTSELSTAPGYQTPISVALSGPHDRGFITYVQDHQITAPERSDDVVAMHIGMGEASQPWVRRMREDGTLVVGGVGWDPTGEWSEQLLVKLNAVDVFVPNHEEAMAYTRADDPVAAVHTLAGFVALAVVTLGADGVVAIDSSTGEQLRVPGIRVPAVDPTGAGDVFTAALMTSFRQAWSLEQRLRFATAAASASVTNLGGATAAPTIRQLEIFVDRYAPTGDWQFVHEWAAQTWSQQTTRER